MKTYFSSIILAIFTLIAFDLLVSKTKNGKLVKSVISLIVTSMLVIPIVNAFNGTLDFGYDNSNGYYSEYLFSIEDKVIKTQVETALNKEGIDALEVNILREENLVKEIRVKIENLVITEDEEHINRLEEIKSCIINALKNLEVDIIIETN